MPKLLTGAKMSERERALRALHRLPGSRRLFGHGDRARLRALLANHRGRWPRTEHRRDISRFLAAFRRVKLEDAIDARKAGIIFGPSSTIKHA